MNIKEIKEMISLMKENEIVEFQLERDGFKVVLKKGGAAGVRPVEQIPNTYIYPQATPGIPQSAAPAFSVAKEEEGVIEIQSPMVGTFYRSASPDAAAYVKKGQEVGPEDVVCIIEAMKIMNEIKSEHKGVIVDILVENGEAVEFGQPLFKLKKV